MLSGKGTVLAEVGEKGIGAQSPCPEDLYNCGVGVRELPVNLVGKGGAYSSK